MIFYGHEEWRVGSLLFWGSFETRAVSTIVCRPMPILTRNFAHVCCIQHSLYNFQVALGSRLTGRRADLAGHVLPTRHAIPNIQILGDARRTR